MFFRRSPCWPSTSERKYTTNSPLLSWLRKTARYRALHAVESRKRRPLLLTETLLDTLDECWQKYDNTPANALADVLRNCVSKLTTHTRRIIALRYVQGLSGIQIAEMLGRKVRTIYMALSRAHGNLRRCVQQEIVDEEGRHA